MANDTVTLTLEIPDGWIDNMILDSDLFRYNCCGYWLRGTAFSEDTWLVWEHDDTRMPHIHESEIEAAFLSFEGANIGRFSAACEVARSLGYDSVKFFMIDRAVAAKIYGECVKLYGMKEAASADMAELDCATQMALLGEIRYG